MGSPMSLEVASDITSMYPIEPAEPVERLEPVPEPVPVPPQPVLAPVPASAPTLPPGVEEKLEAKRQRNRERQRLYMANDPTGARRAKKRVSCSKSQYKSNPTLARAINWFVKSGGSTTASIEEVKAWALASSGIPVKSNA